MKVLKLVLFFAIVSVVTADAQMPNVYADGSVVLNKGNTKFTFVPYARNVIKVVAEPAGYKTNELISDAVIAKPFKTQARVSSSTGADYFIAWDAIRLSVKGDTVFFGSKRNAFITETVKTEGNNSFRFVLTPGEKIFGAGERALPLDRRGYKLNLYNNPWYGYGMPADNLNYSVPVITSSNNYALFFDNPAKGYLDIGKKDANLLEYSTTSGQLNFYIIQGNTYPEILASYHALTGTQPIPPRWAMGNFLSRFGYVSEADVKGVMQKMQQSKIPYDAVIFDLFWFGDSIKGTMGNLAWVNKKAWPNPTKMIADFKKEGTKTVLITEPFVLKQALTYNESKKFHAVDSAGKPYVLSDFYFGAGGLIDIFRKDSRDWFWSKYKLQMNRGVEGWWGDLGEPEKHPANLYHNLRDLGMKRLFKADEVHNLYGHYWTKMLFQKFALEYPNKRLFSLNRSGFAGTQRYSIFPWTGDVSRSWSGLQAQLPVLLGMTMSGVPYTHSDAGGFAGGEKDSELYVRWLQFAQYTPVFKPHGTELSAIDTTVSNFPSEPALFPEPYLSMAKKVVDQRYALLPYNYTLAYEQSSNGKPLMSPLYYYFSNDTGSYRAEDEYMWGPSILVAPVLTKGATNRTLYLPSGKWYNYKTGTAIQGNSWITDSVDMETIPVYIKAGSFIPTNNTIIANTEKYNTSNITVTYFPSTEFSEYILFDDDGKTNKSVEKKQFELVTFETDGWSDDAVFTLRSNGGTFIGKPKSRKITLAIPGVEKLPASISINGKVIADLLQNEAISWNADSKKLEVRIIFTGNPTVIKVKL